jgi:hypothetical protein
MRAIIDDIADDGHKIVRVANKMLAAHCETSSSICQTIIYRQPVPLRLGRRFAQGMMADASYTWSRNMEDTDTGIEDGQGFNAGGTARNYDLIHPERNRTLGLSDIPHRFVGTFLYSVPLTLKGGGSTPKRILKGLCG